MHIGHKFPFGVSMHYGVEVYAGRNQVVANPV